MTERYQFTFEPDSVYANVIDLVAQHAAASGGVVVDLGCGFGAVAEPVRELGLTYVGVDADEIGLKDLESRGFETLEGDLGAPDALLDDVRLKLGARPLAAVVMLDVIEHLTNGPDVLRAVRHLSIARGRAPLILSVPNVTHLDLAAKTLLGRWDVTATGLLDDTHVSLFSSTRLTSMTAATGWHEEGREDFVLVSSDQHFPPMAAPLVDGAPLHDFLRQVRERASEGVFTNQFVRAYLPAAPVRTLPDENESPPFLSVLVRTVGGRGTFEETLLSLAAQTSRNFEILVLAHNVSEVQRTEIQETVESFDDDFVSRTRVVPIVGGRRGRPLNVGVDEARGDYIAILDDDDLAFAHWVETFEVGGTAHPGMIVRSLVAGQAFTVSSMGQVAGYRAAGRPRGVWFDRFDLLRHFQENFTPICAVAIPRTAFTELGLRYDESLNVLEDWDLLVQAASLCGVIDTDQPTSLYRQFNDERSVHLHDEDEWQQVRDTIAEKFRGMPLLVPGDSRNRIADLLWRVDALEREVELLRRGLRSHVVLQMSDAKKFAKRITRQLWR